jgi:hypothetical protein
MCCVLACILTCVSEIWRKEPDSFLRNVSMNRRASRAHQSMALRPHSCLQFGIVVTWNLTSGQQTEVVWQLAGKHSTQRIPEADLEVDEIDVVYGRTSKTTIKDDKMTMSKRVYGVRPDRSLECIVIGTWRPRRISPLHNHVNLHDLWLEVQHKACPDNFVHVTSDLSHTSYEQCYFASFCKCACAL